jgi:hypothetical protein
MLNHYSRNVSPQKIGQWHLHAIPSVHICRCIHGAQDCSSDADCVWKVLGGPESLECSGNLKRNMGPVNTPSVPISPFKCFSATFLLYTERQYIELSHPCVHDPSLQHFINDISPIWQIFMKYGMYNMPLQAIPLLCFFNILSSTEPQYLPCKHQKCKWQQCHLINIWVWNLVLQ